MKKNPPHVETPHVEYEQLHIYIIYNTSTQQYSRSILCRIFRIYIRIYEMYVTSKTNAKDHEFITNTGGRCALDYYHTEYQSI